MAELNSASIPMDSKIKLEPNSALDIIPAFTRLFQSIIGSLIYIALGTRPDIAYSVICLARYAANPTIDHMTMAKWILRYLKLTINQGIIYSN